MLADTPERMEFLKMTVARGRYLGMDTGIISVAEAKNYFPFIEEKYFLGALLDPNEGHLDPSGTTYAYAKAARIQGATIEVETKVEGLEQKPDGTWRVITNKGVVECEHVVNCGGLWAREVGRMVGIELPVLAMEHMYLVTDEIPEVVAYNKATGKEIGHVIDFGAESYLRQEGKGMVLGVYEKACVPWSPRTTPWSFGQELLQPDLDRIAPSLEIAFKHFPTLEHAGIKRVINGPFTFAPDGNPLVGPVQGRTNFWSACGVMAGFSQGGGVGLALSNWMVDGDPGFDIWGMDVSRYGDWATRTYTNAKVRENYARRFSIRFPNEELPAGRPLQTTALYDTFLEQGAVMGDSWGMETPLWFAPSEAEAHDVVSFHRSNDFPHIGAECRAVREAVGVTEIANFAKYVITGPGAEAWLERVMTNTMPRTGRIVLTPMLNHQGKLIGDFTIAKAADDRYMMWGSSQAQVYHMRWFESTLPADGSVRVEPLGMKMVGLSIAGPKARELLQRLTDDDVSNAAFKFMDYREMEVATVRAQVNRITYTGVSEAPVRQPHGRWRRPRAAQLRHARPVVPAPGKELRHLVPRVPPDLRPVRGRAGPLRQARQARLHRQGRGPEGKGRRPQAHAGVPGSGRTRRRRDGRRADLGRRPGGRLGHLGRLRPLRAAVAGAGLHPDRAGAARSATGDRDPG
jgi:dimethylglycine dehydrogenase